jgi:hypothetical protein
VDGQDNSAVLVGMFEGVDRLKRWSGVVVMIVIN